MIDDENDDVERLDLEDLIPKELVEFLSNKMKTVLPKNIQNWKISKALIHVLNDDSYEQQQQQQQQQQPLKKKTCVKDADFGDYDIISIDISSEMVDNDWSVVVA